MNIPTGLIQKETFWEECWDTMSFGQMPFGRHIMAISVETSEPVMLQTIGTGAKLGEGI
jgi:hypothetical protein